MRTIVISFVVAVLLAPSAWAQGEPKERSSGGKQGSAGTTTNPSPSSGGTGRYYVGDVAPDFELPSSRDRPVMLSRQRGDWLLLVFVRDRNDFVKIRTIHDDCQALGVRIFGLCRDNPQGLRTVAQRDSIPFEMLADPTGEISAMYGLYDSMHRTSIPGCLVLDRRGIVRLAVSGVELPATEMLELARLTIMAQ